MWDSFAEPFWATETLRNNLMLANFCNGFGRFRSCSLSLWRVSRLRLRALKYVDVWCDVGGDDGDGQERERDSEREGER